MQYTHETTQQWRLRTIAKLEAQGLLTPVDAERMRATEPVDSALAIAVKADIDRRINELGKGLAQLVFGNGSSQTRSQP